MNKAIKQIQKEFKRHSFDYILFFTAGIFFIIALRLFQGERLIEFLLLLVFVSFYIIWGMYHHIITNTIHLKNMLEYVLIGFTALFLIKIILLP